MMLFGSRKTSTAIRSFHTHAGPDAAGQEMDTMELLTDADPWMRWQLVTVSRMSWRCLLHWLLGVSGCVIVKPN